MIKKFFSNLLIIGLVITGLSIEQPRSSLAAGEASLSITSNKDVYNVGEEVKVTVNVTVESFAASVVQVKLAYDSARLKYKSLDATDSVFPTNVYTSTTSSPATFINSRQATSFTGTGKVFTVVFEATASGSAVFKFNSDSRIWEGGTGDEKPLNISATKTITISVPATPTPQPTSTPPPTSTPTPTSAPTATPAPTSTPKPGADPTVEFFKAEPSSITKGQSSTLKWSAKDVSEVSIDQGVGKVSDKSERGVSPTKTTTYTLTAKNSRATKTASVTVEVKAAVVTATAKPTAKPTAIATATPAPTPVPTAELDPTAISSSQSTIEFSKTTAVADGEDTISLCVVVRTNDGTLVNNVTPALSGLRENVDTASPFIYDEVAQCWTSQITSTEAGLVNITVTADDIVLGSGDLTFTEPTAVDDGAIATEGGGSSFLTMLLIGFFLLLLLLLILYLIWKKLREQDEEEVDESDEAFPGEESPKPNDEDRANFDPNQTLSRGSETENIVPIVPVAEETKDETPAESLPESPPPADQSTPQA